MGQPYGTFLSTEFAKTISWDYLTSINAWSQISQPTKTATFNEILETIIPNILH